LQVKSAFVFFIDIEISFRQ